MKLAELLQKRAKALADWKAVVAKAEGETRDFTADEQKAVEERQAEVADLDKKIAQRRALDEAERTTIAAPAIVSHVGDGTFEQRARNDFSVCRALAASFDRHVDDGLERELGAELAKRTGKQFQGIAIPDEALLPIERRTLTTTGASSLYPQTHRPDLAIEKLRPALLVEALGATVLNDLVGTQNIPKQIGSGTAEWLTEEQALTESDAAFDDVTLQPRCVGSLTSFSRKLLINARPDIENLVRSDLAAVIAIAIDTAALTGDGLNGSPLGISASEGVAQVSMGASPTWEKILAMIAEVESGNALLGSLAWAMAPGVKKALRSIPKVAGDGSAGFLMDSPDQLAGYRAGTSTIMPGDSHDSPIGPGLLIFGNWASLLVGQWSGVDILANPFEGEAYKRGRVWVRAMKDVDTALRHGESFAICDDISQELTT